jgi:hypothetical protein
VNNLKDMTSDINTLDFDNSIQDIEISEILPEYELKIHKSNDNRECDYPIPENINGSIIDIGAGNNYMAILTNTG